MMGRTLMNRDIEEIKVGIFKEKHIFKAVVIANDYEIMVTTETNLDRLKSNVEWELNSVLGLEGKEINYIEVL